MRFFNERMASLGCTVFDRITSDISRLRAMSSLDGTHQVSKTISRKRYAGREVGRGVLVQATARGLLYLLIQGSVCPGRPPSHHPGGLFVGTQAMARTAESRCCDGRCRRRWKSGRRRLAAELIDRLNEWRDKRPAGISEGPSTKNLKRYVTGRSLVDAPVVLGTAVARRWMDGELLVGLASLPTVGYVVLCCLGASLRPGAWPLPAVPSPGLRSC